MNLETTVLASTSVFLLNPIKALLIFAPFLAWAWLISTKLEADAQRCQFDRKKWNGIYMACGIAALAIMLLVPGTVFIFWITWPIGLVILVAPILTYWKLRNASVPANKRFYLTSESMGKVFERRRQTRASADVTIRFTDSEGKQRQVPMKDDPLHEVYAMAEEVILPALAARATRVEIAISPKGCQISQTIDGVRYKREPLAVEPAVRLIDFLKDVAGLDVEDRRRQQAGEFTLKGSDDPVTVHLVTAGSSNSQVMRIDFNRSDRLIKPFDGLGILSAQEEPLKQLVERETRHGIVLIGAPSGHGLTTSLYSFLNRHDAYTTNIKTLERTIEVDLDGVDQILWDSTNPDVDFASNLQSILRRDPDIVMTGELPDRESAQVAIEPGMDGPLIYIPVHAGSIHDVLRAWIKQVGDAKRAVKPLRLVTNQRLLRTLCPNCRQAYQPSPDQLKKLGIPDGKVKQLYRASGKIQVKNKIETCAVCGGTGYLGQTAAFEIMPVDDQIREHIIAGDIKAALNHARRDKMIYLQEAALSKVLSGETTIEEVIRVTAPKKARATTKAA